MTRTLIHFLWSAALISPAAYAHQQPTTLALLNIGSNDVVMDLHVPLSELELAFGHNVNQNPKQTIRSWEGPFRKYIAAHIHPTTTAGVPWTLETVRLSLADAQQVQSGPFQEVLVRLLLTPPRGASVRSWTLRYDLIMHQVVTHKAIVSVQNDWAAGRFESKQPAASENTPAQIGVIAVDTGTTQIAPLAIRLGKGSSWTGFSGMVKLGMQHIREGTDHLLFLIVLLLTSTLQVSGGRWGTFGGTAYSFLRIGKIVTAFTLGHTVTLIAGTLHWVNLPQQPVEVLIAFSILVTSIHAIRPVFPGREWEVAGGFGLVHGLAFASVLAELNLPSGPMAFSILGFNLGLS